MVVVVVVAAGRHSVPLCPVCVTLSFSPCQGFTYSHSWDVGRAGEVTLWVLCSPCLSFPAAQPYAPHVLLGPGALRLWVPGGCASAWQQCMV